MICFGFFDNKLNLICHSVILSVTTLATAMTSTIYSVNSVLVTPTFSKTFDPQHVIMKTSDITRKTSI